MALTKRLRRLEERHGTGDPAEPFFLLVRLMAVGSEGPVDRGIHHCVVISPPGHGRFDRQHDEDETAFIARINEATGINVGDPSGAPTNQSAKQ